MRALVFFVFAGISAAGPAWSADGTAPAVQPTRAQLQVWRDRFETHVRDKILAFWLAHDVDEVRGGFYGALDRTGKPDPLAERSLILNARLLWTFSAASRMYTDPAYRIAAKRAYDYLEAKFRDQSFKGGYYWSVDADGKPKDDHKYVYGQSFVVYGLTEYWLMAGEKNLNKKIYAFFHQFDIPAHDRANGGYMESFKRDWKPELKVDPIGPPDQKSANTHLHLLESISSLATTGHPQLRQRLTEIRNLFVTRMVDPAGYTHEYFTPDWKPTKNESSYGHDVELAWLLPESNRVLGIPEDDPDTVRISKSLVDHALKYGFDHDRGGFFERGPGVGPASDRSKNWWAQAEGLVGLLEVYRMTNDPTYFAAFEKTAQFIFRDLADAEYGEWYPGTKADGTLVGTEKATFWKCPYHNTRACLETIRRLDALIARTK